MVKFNKSINEYDYVLSFDLAKHNTGYSLYNLSDKTVVLTGMIIGEEKENYWYGLYEEFEHLLLELSSKFDKKKIFVIKEKWLWIFYPAKAWLTAKTLNFKNRLKIIKVETDILEKMI